MYKKILLIAVVVYAVSAGLSYAVFTKIGLPMSRTVVEENLPEETALGALLNIDPNEPRDQACPLNGKLYTNTERQAWEKRRPLAVMIENDVNARPQAGLGSADVVMKPLQKAVSRGLWLCFTVVPRDMTPPLPQFVQLEPTSLIGLLDANALCSRWRANIPGPTDALGQINTYGWAYKMTSTNSLQDINLCTNANRLGPRLPQNTP